MNAELWGLFSAVGILALALGALCLRGVALIRFQASCALVLATLGTVVSMVTFLPDFGGLVLLVVGLSLGFGLGAAMEIATSQQAHSWLSFPPVLAALGLLVIAIATIEDPYHMGHDGIASGACSMMAAAAAAWVVGRAVGKLLERRRLVGPLGPGPVFVVKAVLCGVILVALFRPTLGGFWGVSAAALIGGVLTAAGEARPDLNSRHVSDLFGWTAVSLALLGAATGSVLMLAVGGFVAAALFGRRLPQSGAGGE